MIRKLLKVLLLGIVCLLVMAFLMPKSTPAAPSSIILVNGCDIISDADHTVQCGKGKAVYDPATGVLTLINAQIDNPDSSGNGIYSNGDLSVIIDGTTSISGCTNGINAYGSINIKDLDSRGGLCILGSGSTGNGICSSSGSVAVRLKGDILLSSPSSCILSQDMISIVCNKVDICALDHDSIGIKCANSISISTVSGISIKAGYKGISSDNKSTVAIDCSQGSIDIECRQLGIIALSSAVTINSFSDIHISSTEAAYTQLSHAGITAETLQLKSLNGGICISGNGSYAISTSGNIDVTAEKGSFKCGKIWVSNGAVNIAAKDAAISSDTYGVQSHTHVSIYGNITITGGLQALYPHYNTASGEIEIAQPPDKTRKILTADNAAGNNAQEYTSQISLLDNPAYKYVRISYTSPVKEMVLDKSGFSLVEGSSDILIPVFTPSNATNQKVTWYSSDESVILVDSGKIKALKSGYATITAISEDGSIRASCMVTVISNAAPTQPPSIESAGPITGDTGPYILYIALLAASAVLIIYFIIRRSMKH